jgi:uncharacterized protein (DUF1778 family)
MSVPNTATPPRAKSSGSSPRKSAPIHIRAPKRQRELIDSASALLGKTRSDFMLEAACREAEAVILDKRVIQMNSKEYNQFVALLDAPPQARPGLKALFNVRSPWER